MSKANYTRAIELYPSTQMDDRGWKAAFDANEDIMWSIIGDIYDAVKTEEEKAAGIRRMGRRPARQGTSMEEVYRTIFPQQFTMDPFREAFEKLLKGKSQRQIAAKIPCDQATISRLLNGRLIPDLRMLERAAEACGVPPFFFVEYRALMVGQLVTQVLLEQPHMGVTAVKRLRAGVPA